MDDMELISSSTLKELAGAGSIQHTVVVEQPDGYAITVKYGLAKRVVQARRGHVRHFKTIDAAAKALKSLGIVRFELDMSNPAT